MKTRITNYQEQLLALKLIAFWGFRASENMISLNEEFEISILEKRFSSRYASKNRYIKCEEWCLSVIHPDPYFPEIISTGYYLKGSEEVFKNDMLMLKMLLG